VGAVGQGEEEEEEEEVVMVVVVLLLLLLLHCRAWICPCVCDGSYRWWMTGILGLETFLCLGEITEHRTQNNSETAASATTVCAPERNAPHSRRMVIMCMNGCRCSC